MEGREKGISRDRAPGRKSIARGISGKRKEVQEGNRPACQKGVRARNERGALVSRGGGGPREGNKVPHFIPNNERNLEEEARREAVVERARGKKKATRKGICCSQRWKVKEHRRKAILGNMDKAARKTPA